MSLPRSRGICRWGVSRWVASIPPPPQKKGSYKSCIPYGSGIGVLWYKLHTCQALPLFQMFRGSSSHEPSHPKPHYANPTAWTPKSCSEVRHDPLNYSRGLNLYEWDFMVPCAEYSLDIICLQFFRCRDSLWQDFYLRLLLLPGAANASVTTATTVGGGCGLGERPQGSL